MEAPKRLESLTTGPVGHRSCHDLDTETELPGFGFDSRALLLHDSVVVRVRCSPLLHVAKMRRHEAQCCSGEVEPNRLGQV